MCSFWLTRIDHISSLSVREVKIPLISWAQVFPQLLFPVSKVTTHHLQKSIIDFRYSSGKFQPSLGPHLSAFCGDKTPRQLSKSFFLARTGKGEWQHAPVYTHPVNPYSSPSIYTTQFFHNAWFWKSPLLPLSGPKHFQPQQKIKWNSKFNPKAAALLWKSPNPFT